MKASDDDKEERLQMLELVARQLAVEGGSTKEDWKSFMGKAKRMQQDSINQWNNIDMDDVKRSVVGRFIVNPDDHEAAEHRRKGDPAFYRIIPVPNGLPNYHPVDAKVETKESFVEICSICDESFGQPSQAGFNVERVVLDQFLCRAAICESCLVNAVCQGRLSNFRCRTFWHCRLAQAIACRPYRGGTRGCRTFTLYDHVGLSVTLGIILHDHTRSWQKPPTRPLNLEKYS